MSSISSVWRTYLTTITTAGGRPIREQSNSAGSAQVGWLALKNRRYEVTRRMTRQKLSVPSRKLSFAGAEQGFELQIELSQAGTPRYALDPP